MFPQRRLIKRRAFFGLLGVGTVGCFADARWIEPGWIQVSRRLIRMPSWPGALDGLRIAVAADFHYCGLPEDLELLEKFIRLANREKPDIILLPGDFINSDDTLAVPLAKTLSGLCAPKGVFCSMGNHDVWNSDTRSFRRHFRDAGLHMLVNENALVSHNGQTLAVAGIDSVWGGRPDAGKMLSGVADDTPVIALVHEPDYFDVMRIIRPSLLQVSGHTHGGQCRVPFFGLAPVLPRFGRKYPYGPYESGDSRLFVTRGVGTTGYRVRFACPPELAILTLRCG